MARPGSFAGTATRRAATSAVMEVGLVSASGLHPAGEPGGEQGVTVSKLNARLAGKISRLAEMAAPGVRQPGQRDPGGDTDVEALREPGHRDAEGARAGTNRRERWPLVLVAEQKRDRPVGGQCGVEPAPGIEVAGPDLVAVRAQLPCRRLTGRMRLHVDPLVRILR